MKEVRLFILLFYSYILVAGFASCVSQSKRSIEARVSSEAKIDSTKWLIPCHGIRDIFEDSNGNLWFSNREFVCKYDGSEYRYFDRSNGFVGIATNIHEDPNGNILIETNIRDSLYGISIFDGKKFTFQEFPTRNSNQVLDVSEDDVWFSVPIKPEGKWEGSPGVFRYRDNKFDFLQFPVPDTENQHNKYWATSKVVRGKDGTLWFATIETVFGYKDGEFTVIDRDVMGRADDPVPVGIRGLFEDNDGKLWLADNGSGIYVYDGSTVMNFTRQHRLGKDDKEGNTLHRAFSIAEDDHGNMWFGAVYSGIWRYNKASNEFTNFGKESGFISDLIWMIHKTKNGDLLFAGETPGAVYQFNGNSFDRVY